MTPSSSAGSASRFDVEVYQGLAGLDALAAPWQEVLARIWRPRFFHYRQWWRSYVEAFDSEAQTHFFLVLENDRPAAIVPLQCTALRHGGIGARTWQLPRHDHLPLRDIVCARGVPTTGVLAALEEALEDQAVGGWDVMAFDGVLGDSALAAGSTADRRVSLVAAAQSCDQVSCAGNYVAMTAHFSANFRSNLNKARNKLARETGIEFSRVSRAPELDRCFAEFLDLEASGWKGREGRGTAIKLDPALVRFYGGLIEGFGADDMAVINCLRMRGELIAGQLCLRDEDTLYILKLAYDEGRARLAPGNMLLEWTIREGMERGAYRYVNLVGEPPWFKDWRPISMPLLSLSLFNTTPGGWTARSLIGLKQQLRPLRNTYRSVQQGVRAALSSRQA